MNDSEKSTPLRRDIALMWLGVATLLLGGCSSDSGLSNVAPEDSYSVEAGASYTCVLREGTVECWGAFPGAGEPRATPSVRTERDVEVLDLDAGFSGYCLVLGSGAVRCEGIDASWPSGQRAVVTRWDSVCALDQEGKVTCRDGTNTPVNIDVPTATDLVSTWQHTCALHPDGTASCWQDPAGDGRIEQQPTELNADLTDAVELTMGWEESCARHRDGHVSCVSADGNRYVVPNLNNARGLSSGAVSCALTAERTVKCWGDNSTGLVGVPSNGPNDVRGVPVEVPGLKDIIDVDVSFGPMVDAHVCAVDAAGEVICWGANTRMQLGSNLLTSM